MKNCVAFRITGAGTFNFNLGGFVEIEGEKVRIKKINSVKVINGRYEVTGWVKSETKVEQNK